MRTNLNRSYHPRYQAGGKSNQEDQCECDQNDGHKLGPHLHTELDVGLGSAAEIVSTRRNLRLPKSLVDYNWHRLCAPAILDCASPLALPVTGNKKVSDGSHLKWPGGSRSPVTDPDGREARHP